jgi:2-keto-4-pentenoate hydratase/2-oxohepta-3-ene-1,7-dioic acid hydratase in catechol pathway
MTASTTSWKRFIRFIGPDGKVYRGEPLCSPAVDIGKLASSGQPLEAKVIAGDNIFSAIVTEQILEVKKLLGPLTPSEVPIIKCVGLNYMKHIQEGGRTPPPFPSIFYKPSACVADHGEPIPIPKLAQDDQCDYEGELCVVIGRDGKDIPVEDALSFVAGYTAGNDVSARKWQRDPKFAGGVPQWCFSKSFDKYAPLGPVVVSPSFLENAGELVLQTRVNGELRQDTNTNDLLFGISRIISFISQGTTLQAGTVIMTGTPSGVAMGMKVPKYLSDGDLVEVYIEKIGTLSNQMKFE